jgi:hypothetical protein
LAAAAAASASIAETCPGSAGCSRVGGCAGLVGAFKRGASAQLRRLLWALDVVWYRCRPQGCSGRADLSCRGPQGGGVAAACAAASAKLGATGDRTRDPVIWKGRAVLRLLNSWGLLAAGPAARARVTVAAAPLTLLDAAYTSLLAASCAAAWVCDNAGPSTAHSCESAGSAAASCPAIHVTDRTQHTQRQSVITAVARPASGALCRLILTIHQKITVLAPVC